MNRSPDPSETNEELRAFEAKLRTLEPREVNLDWPAILDAQTVSAPSSFTSSSKPTNPRRRRKLTLAATWLSGVAAGCLIMASFQSPTQSDPPRSSTTNVSTESPTIAMGSDETTSTNADESFHSHGNIAAIIEEPTIRLCSASHLDKSPVLANRENGLTMSPKSDNVFVPRSLTPTARGSRRELMDELLGGDTF